MGFGRPGGKHAMSVKRISKAGLMAVAAAVSSNNLSRADIPADIRPKLPPLALWFF